MLSELDKEYRKIFFNQKRWVKHWTTHSAHRAHSNTLHMMTHAEKALEYILEIEKMKITEKERVNLLLNYYKSNKNDVCDTSNNGLDYQLGVLEQSGKAHIFKMIK